MSAGSGFVEEYRRPSARETLLKTDHGNAAERVREAPATASEGVAETFEGLAPTAGHAAADD